MALGAYVYGLNPLATGVPSVVMIDIDPWQSRISLFEAPTRTTCFFFQVGNLRDWTARARFYLRYIFEMDREGKASCVELT